MDIKRTIILNPYARSRRAGHLWYEIFKTAEDAKIKITKRPGNATSKAIKAVQRGSDVVVAAGGDGTINEVLNGIIGSEAFLGILPLGSVNVFARQIKLPIHIGKAWNVIEGHQVRYFDTVRVDYDVQGTSRTKHFIQLAGIGLDADIVKSVTWEQKQRWGPLSYVFAGLRLVGTKLPKLKIVMDDFKVDQGGFVLIGNGAYYGGPFSVFHKASMEDGFMDVCVFDSYRKRDVLNYLHTYLLHPHSKLSGVRYHQCKVVSVSSEETVPFEIDGEYTGYLPARFTVIPKSIGILVPPGH